MPELSDSKDNVSSDRNFTSLVTHVSNFYDHAYEDIAYWRQHHSASDFYNHGVQLLSDRKSLPNFAVNSSEQLKIDRPGDYSETVVVDAVPRHYQLHVPPSYDATKQMPLVVVLHGHGQDGAELEKKAGIDEEADRKGFIVAYPDATQWFGEKRLSARDTGNGLTPTGTHVDDVGFISKVIDCSQSQLSIDPARIYMVGVSNGGMEVYKAASELSGKIAAVVSISGAMSGEEMRPKTPVSVLNIVGTKDVVVPPTGRTVKEEAASVTPEILPILAKEFPQLKDELNSSGIPTCAATCHQGWNSTEVRSG